MTATLVAVVIAAGLAACGGSAPRTDAAGRPLLPSFAGGDTGAAAVGKVANPSASPTDDEPPRVVEYQLAPGLTVPEREAPAYRFAFADDPEERVRRVLGVGDAGAFEVEFTGAWYWQRATIDDPITDPCDSSSCPTPPGLPTWEEAETRFRAILEALGFDPDEGRFDPFDHPQERQLSFIPRIGGLEVGYLESGIGFGTNGQVEFAGGFLGTVERLGEYPLATLDDAFAAADVAFDGGPRPAANVKTKVVEVTGARLALEVVFPPCDGDDLLLVPVYLLLPEDTVGHAIPAVDEGSTAEPSDDEPGCPDEASMGDPVAPDPRRLPRSDRPARLLRA
jgi:hypothetical protein